jgi:muramoyltetrapeptide carboxypeptidase
MGAEMGSKVAVPVAALRPGSRVGLVAPAGPLLERDDLTRGQELCRALGWEPVLAPSAGNRYGYLAGTDDERVADLNAALRDDTLDAVWCLRGGYGMTRILPQLDLVAFARYPKAVIGFSDITALLTAIQVTTGVVTFHGPMARAQLTRFSADHLRRVLTRPATVSPPGGPAATIPLDRLPPPADVLVPREHRVVTLRPGVAEGRLMGGNLTLLQCLIGTRFFPHLDGAILFLEDIGEELYRVDRMLSHFRLIGALEKVAGVIIGQFTEMKRTGGDGSLGFDEVLATYLLPLGIPVAYGLPIGHVDDQWTLPVGVRSRFDAGAGSLELLESPTV